MPRATRTAIEKCGLKIEPKDNKYTRKLHNINKEMETGDTHEASSSTTPALANQHSTDTTDCLSTALP